MNDKLKRLKEVGEQATDGPWWVSRVGCDVVVGYETQFTLFDVMEDMDDDPKGDQCNNDAQFAVEARNNWDYLIRQCEKLEALKEWAKDIKTWRRNIKLSDVKQTTKVAAYRKGISAGIDLAVDMLSKEVSSIIESE